MLTIWEIWGFGGPIRVYLGVKLSFCPDTYFLKNLPFSIFSLDFLVKNPIFFRSHEIPSGGSWWVVYGFK